MLSEIRIKSLDILESFLFFTHLNTSIQLRFLIFVLSSAKILKDHMKSTFFMSSRCPQWLRHIIAYNSSISRIFSRELTGIHYIRLVTSITLPFALNYKQKLEKNLF
jgi:hypothetical protein